MEVLPTLSPESIRWLNPCRSDDEPMPMRWPDGWVPLPVAAAVLLDRAYGTNDNNWVLSLRSLLEMGADPKFYEQGDSYGHKLAAWLIEGVTFSCMTGVLVAGFRPAAGGCPVLPMPQDWWDIERPEMRFRTWGIDPEQPTADLDSPPCWIWIERESLDKQAEKIWISRHQKKIRARYEGEWLTLEEAVFLAAEVVGAEDVATALDALLFVVGSGGGQVVAGEMVRYYRGKPCWRDIHCAIPLFVWQGVDPADLAIRVSEGSLIATLGDTVFALLGLRFDAVQLRDTFNNGPIFARLGGQAMYAPSTLRGTLPPQAKPNDHKHEQYAHEAAELMRREKMTAQSAFVRVAPSDPMRDQESVVRAIRHAFDLMYDSSGHPIKH